MPNIMSALNTLLTKLQDAEKSVSEEGSVSAHDLEKELGVFSDKPEEECGKFDNPPEFVG